MQVLCSEGLASHTGPEPCVGPREGPGEASAGERAGRPSSRERATVPGADVVTVTEGHTSGRVSASARRPGVVRVHHNVELLGRLRSLARQGPITLVYPAHDEAHNDAIVLRNFLLGRQTN